MPDGITRAILITAGLACVGCEVWGSYDYMIEKYGRWNYLVVGSLVLTALAAVLPVGAEFAHRQGMRGLKWAAWCAVPLAVAFVFTVSIQRTGGATDTDEAGRRQIAENIRIAKQEAREAEDQLPLDKALVTKNCGVWGPVCTKAKADQAATEGKLAAARATLKQHGVAVDDSMARRLVAYLPFLTKEQVQLYQPMLLPMGLAIIGSLLVAIGVRRKATVSQLTVDQPKVAEVLAPALAAEPAQMRTGSPVLKLVSVKDEKPSGSIPKILTAALDPATGERVEFAEVYRRYRLDCAAEGNSAVSPEQFADPLKRFCKGAGIRTKAQGEHLYLLNVRIGGARADHQHATM